MSVTAIKKVISSGVGRKMLFASKHSPSMLLGAGVVGFVGTVVLAIQATGKLEGIVKDAEDKSAAINEDEELSDKDRVKAQKKLKVRTCVKVARTYAPTVGLGILSIVAIGQGHAIQLRRLGGVSAAYATIDQSYREYRKRVIEELGDEQDAKFRHGLVEKEVIVDEGPEGPVFEKRLRVPEDQKLTGYAKCFAKGESSQWQNTKDRNTNRLFVRANQSYANDLLNARGYLFLSEVYKMLGFEETQASRVVGWVKGSKNGDSHVDFGLFRNGYKGEQFMTGEIDEIWLDFNVDGPILSALDKW